MFLKGSIQGQLLADVPKNGDICFGITKKRWCRVYFSLDNFCETFNSWFVGAGHKSIISMLEEI